jgi:hypothetical protein
VKGAGRVKDKGGMVSRLPASASRIFRASPSFLPLIWDKARLLSLAESLLYILQRGRSECVYGEGGIYGECELTAVNVRGAEADF